MSAGVSFRVVTPEDEGFLRRVYASTREEELQAAPWTAAERSGFLNQQFDLQRHHYEKHFPHASYQVVLVDGERAGRLYVDRGPAEIRILDIALLPDYRGTGLGTSMLEKILTEAREGGVPVRIHVERSNPAQSLYTRLGFEPVEERGLYYLMEWRG